jgi:hypothetical protein
MNDLYMLQLGGERIENRARSVGGVVVHEKDVQVEAEGEDLADEPLHVAALVERGDQDEEPPHC